MMFVDFLTVYAQWKAEYKTWKDARDKFKDVMSWIKYFAKNGKFWYRWYEPYNLSRDQISWIIAKLTKKGLSVELSPGGSDIWIISWGRKPEPQYPNEKQMYVLYPDNSLRVSCDKLRSRFER